MQKQIVVQLPKRLVEQDLYKVHTMYIRITLYTMLQINSIETRYDFD